MSELHRIVTKVLKVAHDQSTHTAGDLYGVYDEKYQGIIFFNDIRHPAVEFAEQHNCPEILGDYILPKGVTGTDLQTCAMALKVFFHNSLITEDQYDSVLDKIWTELVQLNPSLKALDIYKNAPMNYLAHSDKPMKAKFHLIMGIGDRFNLSDITAFMNVVSKTRAEIFNDNASKDRLITDIAEKFSQPFWRLSDQTYNLLIQIYQSRQARPPAYNNLPPKTAR